MLACDKAPTATLEAIAVFEKENKQTLSPAAAVAKPIVERVEEEIESEDNNDMVSLNALPIKKPLTEAPSTKKPAALAAAGSTPKAAKEKMAPTAPVKKKAATPSTCTHCAQLLKFLVIVQHQHHHYDELEEEILSGSMVCPTLELEHCQWAAIQQVQAKVNQPKITPDQ
jgi:hypothetical protein